MAILDWPTTDEFKPMQPLTLGYSTPKSAFVGAYTGERQQVTRAADRLVMEMLLPPCRGQAARRRAAWLASLASTGDLVRMPAWPQRYPLGTFGGAPTVNGAVAAGLRSVNLAGALSRPNMLFNGTSIDGSTWTTSGTTVSANAHTGPLGSVDAERITATTGSADYVYQPVTLVVGRTYTLSAYFANFTSTQSRIMVRKLSTSAEATLSWSGAVATAATLVTGTSASFSAGANSYYRVWVTFVAAESDAWVRLYPATAATQYVAAWGIQIQEGASPTAYAGQPTLLAGDVLGIGGNLLMVGPSDVTLTDAGAGAVNIVAGAPRAISNGAAVTYMAPTGVWQLDTLEAPPAEYGAVQSAVSIAFRQVAQ